MKILKKQFPKKSENTEKAISRNKVVPKTYGCNAGGNRYSNTS